MLATVFDDGVPPLVYVAVAVLVSLVLYYAVGKAVVDKMERKLERIARALERMSPPPKR